jgi:hypothetical protein
MKSHDGEGNTSQRTSKTTVFSESLRNTTRTSGGAHSQVPDRKYGLFRSIPLLNYEYEGEIRMGNNGNYGETDVSRVSWWQT